MKKPNNNNKHRNNNGYNPNYSLNYKFDSNSPAGKITGTALELIRRYNDLAKDAYSNNDYVVCEVYRQYAEHYRKIVTDINERRGNFNYRKDNNQNQSDDVVETAETQAPAEEISQPEAAAPKETQDKKEFKIIEISEAKDASRPKRTYRRKMTEEASAL